MENETWLPIGGDNEVSSHGRVRNRHGKVMTHTTQSGFSRVCITIDGKRTSLCVQVLVADAFHGPKPTGWIVRHRDDDKHNNRADNVYWRKAHRAAKLTEEQVRDILLDLAAGAKMTAIAARYGVSSSAIDHIAIGKTWRHVPRP